MTGTPIPGDTSLGIPPPLAWTRNRLDTMPQGRLALLSADRGKRGEKGYYYVTISTITSRITAIVRGGRGGNMMNKGFFVVGVYMVLAWGGLSYAGQFVLYDAETGEEYGPFVRARR